MTKKEIIQKLKCDKVVIAVPKLRKLVKKLEKKHTKEERINNTNLMIKTLKWYDRF